MKINWIINTNGDETLHQYCVELEYRLRPKIIKFLISRIDPDCCFDFSCFHFDIDVVGRKIQLSKETPKQYYTLIEAEFPKKILDFSKI
ncbi:hypothetical protein D1013_16655 [Euzebyella marina]|uniref:Uncharacterized protein n=1 Tax=Euzebyella marina TaxID=1761453 RepID=A0A3G2L9K2_9FLAO|nr:hypothetical protein [Euzebyella marina]AYN68893.1 hypothetical protein D1013_16655 [Euzebyella marina]